MADWTTITDTQVDPKAPVTSELMTALRDNPLAIAEGSTNAPKIAQSVRYAFVGINTYATISNLSAGSGVHGSFRGASGPLATGTVTVEFSSNGSTWTNSQNLGSASGNGNSGYSGDFYFDFSSGLFLCNAQVFTDVSGSPTTRMVTIQTTLSSMASTDYMRFYLSSAAGGSNVGLNVIAYVNGGTAAT